MTEKANPLRQQADGRQKSGILLVLIAVFASLVVVDLLFLVFIRNEFKTIKLLKNELQVLEQNQKIINSSRDITAAYSEEIELISQAFPNEETIPQFVKILENMLKSYADEYNFRFNAVAPIKEQEKSFLPLTITLRTDYLRLLALLDKLETLPYMTHITTIISRNPDGFTDKSETVIGLKLYVQNPFSSK